MKGDMVVLRNHNICLTEFPELLKKHTSIVANTEHIEDCGDWLRCERFTDDELRQFIEKICHWGGYAGIAGRIYVDNKPLHIRRQFESAIQILWNNIADVDKSLVCMNKVKQLGTPSFASKMLRFLFPESCPVLDKIVHEKLHYTFDPIGYREYARDCWRIGIILTDKKIENPRNRENRKWFAGDIDMAVYAHLNNW